MTSLVTDGLKELFTHTFKSNVKLKTLAGIEEISRESLGPVIEITESMGSGDWPEVILSVADKFHLEDTTPDPSELVLVAAALEARVHLDRILMNTLDPELFDCITNADVKLGRCGPSLYFLSEQLYRIALRNTHNQRTVAGTWTAWREDMIQKALGEAYYGEC